MQTIKERKDMLNTHTVTADGVFTNDVFSEEFNTHRRIYITGRIDADLSTEVCAAITHLADRSKEDIWLIFNNCPGGSVGAGNAILDIMKTCGCDICTLALGDVASMGTVLFSSGTGGKRFISNSAVLMMHQASGNVSGQISDLLNAAQIMKKNNSCIFAVLAANSGKTITRIRRDCENDYYMDCEESLEYGLADKVFSGWSAI